jgi:hypothetical protein
VVTGAARPVAPEQFRAHAENLDAVRLLLGEVRVARARVAQDAAGFGSVCGWLLSGLGDRHVKQQELIAYVEETLLGWAQALREVADGGQELKVFVRHDGDVATIDGTPLVEGPAFSSKGIVDSVLSRVERQEWVEPQLGDAAPVAEFAAPVSRWYLALRIGGLHCALTFVDPVRRFVDDLAGAPDVVAADASGWAASSTDLIHLSVLLEQCVEEDIPRRDRLDVRSYHARMAYNVDSLVALAELARSMAVITRQAGELISLTADIVRGIIGDLFATVIAWATGIPAGIPVPSASVQFGTVVATAWRIHAYMDALTTSISQLERSVGG